MRNIWDKLRILFIVVLSVLVVFLAYSNSMGIKKEFILGILYFGMFAFIFYKLVVFIFYIADNIIYGVKRRWNNIFHKKIITPEQEKQNRIANARPNVYYVSGRKELIDIASRVKEDGYLKNLYVSSNDNEQGAFMILNKRILERNKEIINSGLIVRDSEERKRSRVPYYDTVRRETMDYKGQKKYLWHRTHLIPFRYSLSDGNIDNIMFAGTSYLNTGNRYKKGYVLPNNGYGSADDRVKTLYDKLLGVSKDYGFSLNESRIDKTVTKDVGYSLNDFELLTDYFLNKNPDKTYMYGVICYGEAGDVPKHVGVTLVDLTANRTIFTVYLNNEH